MEEDFDPEEEECLHPEYENGRCIGCGEYYEPDDFSGASEGDR